LVFVRNRLVQMRNVHALCYNLSLTNKNNWKEFIDGFLLLSDTRSDSIIQPNVHIEQINFRFELPENIQNEISEIIFFFFLHWCNVFVRPILINSWCLSIIFMLKTGNRRMSTNPPEAASSSLVLLLKKEFSMNWLSFSWKETVGNNCSRMRPI
jgi:hypothetical protein